MRHKYWVQYRVTNGMQRQTQNRFFTTNDIEVTLDEFIYERETFNQVEISILNIVPLPEVV